MTKQAFIKGALVLILASSFVRIIGFLYQIIIVRLIGTEGIGIFNLIFPLYIMALVLTTAGLPLAVSRLVAKSLAEGNGQRAFQYFKTALVLLILFSSFSTIILYLLAPTFLKLIYQDSRVFSCFFAILPGIIIVSISSALRGFFQGLQEMTPTAIGQCIEQVIRFCLGVLLVIKFKPYGITMTVIGLVIAMIAGEVGGLLYIFFLYKKRRLQNQLISGQKARLTIIIKDLINFGLPVTFTRLVASIVYTMEASLIPKSLIKSGFTLNQATALYGEFTGVALTLLSIPTILTISLATSLVPAISEAESQKQLHTLRVRSSDALHITYIFGLPTAFLLFWYGSDISKILFGLYEAGVYLKILSIGSIFLYLQQTTTGILQGLGAVNKILIHTTIGAVVKFLGIYSLTIKFGLKGVAFSFVLTFFIVSILNLLSVKNLTKATLINSKSVLPIISLIVMIYSIIKIFDKLFLVNSVFNLLLIIVFSLLVYFSILIIFKDPTLKQIIFLLKNKV